MRLEIVGLVVPLILIAALVIQSMRLDSEKASHQSTRDRLEAVEVQLRAAQINQKALTKLDKQQRAVGEEVDRAVASSETLADAIDAIERMEGR